MTDLSNVAQAYARVDRLLTDRLTRVPDSANYAQARRELDKFADRLHAGTGFDTEFYETQNLGLLCVREFDNTDPEFCDAVFDLLNAIRPPNYS